MRRTPWPLLFLLISGIVPAGHAAGSRTFSDRFDGDLSRWGTAYGRWQVKEGVLVQDTDWAMAQLPFPEKEIGQFQLTYKMRFDSPEVAAQTGLTIDRGEGYWLITLMGSGQLSWAFIARGEKTGLFHAAVTTVFREKEWVEFTVTCMEDRLELRLNGQTYVAGPAPGKGQVCLKARKGVRLDDVTLTYDTAGNLYPNRQINGSFEHATNGDVPDYWDLPGGWTRMNHGLPDRWLTEAGIKELRAKWRLDGTTAFQGTNSLRIAYPFAAASSPMSVAATNDHLVSLYLKSDRPGMRVRLAADFQDRNKPVAARELETGTTWQRHTLALPRYPHDSLSVSVTPLDSGTLWMDAVQIEQGNVPTDYGPCWYDAGFSLPLFPAHVTPPREYRDKTHRVVFATNDISLPAPSLQSSDASRNAFRLEQTITNSGQSVFIGQLTVAMEVLDRETQFKTAAIALGPGATTNLVLDGLTVPVDRHRCRIGTVITDPHGTLVRQERRFLDVPHPLRLYPEFSHYATEKEARMAVVFGFPAETLQHATLEMEVRLALQKSETLSKKTFTPRPGPARQLFSIPINTPGWTPYTPYEVTVRLLDTNGSVVAQALCDIGSLPPRTPDVRVNHINRGLYLNGEPYLPYGVYFAGTLPDRDLLRFYRRCGFDFIAVLTHRSSVAQARDFLEQCGQEDLWASVTHLSRKYSMDATDMARRLEGSPSLILFNPVDEVGLLGVYETIAHAKHVNPHVVCYANENTAGYQNFSDQLRGFPGEILSCDRYPLIGQPRGWPQTVTDVNGIYSFEERIEWMDRDGKRDRKPLHFYLQAAEHQSREPVPTELTWLTYIALVNHCTAFTYFAGIPHSRPALESMIQLNREVQSLKPALFSLEDDPPVKAIDEQTRANIRFLVKQVGEELTVIGVNRALYPVDATLDLSAAGVAATSRIEVLFEARQLTAGPGGRLADRFEPLARHVYRIRGGKM